MHSELIENFEKTVQNIFGPNLVFGFICGSFARKIDRKNSDIDFFICLRTIKEDQLKLFSNWYFKIHKQYDRTPDKDYPGEIMNLNQLEDKLNSTLNCKPSFSIKDLTIFDGIVWAGMMYGISTAFIGDKDIYFSLKKKAELITHIWKNSLIKKLKDTDNDIFLKKNTVYLK